MLRDLVQGLGYIRRTPEVRWLVSLTATVPLAGVLFFTMPFFARDVLQVGSEGLGIFVATYGVAALASSIFLTLLGNIRHKALVVVLSALVYAGGMLIFAFSESFYVSLVAVGLTGAASTFWKNTTATMVQTSAADEMRGRVMGVFGMGAQMLALGWLLGGVLATVVGVQVTLAIAGILIAALNLFVYARSREVRQIV